MPAKLEQNNAILFVIDIQEKLVNMLKEDYVSQPAFILAKTAKTLGIPVIITEQYPKGLGETIECIKAEVPDNAMYFEKVTFNALDTEGIESAISNMKKKQIILCGIEAHICVMQTALDFLTKGYEVFVVKDACASRKKSEFKLSMKRLETAGAVIVSSEMVLFELLKSAKHPNFKELQSLIK